MYTAIQVTRIVSAALVLYTTIQPIQYTAMQPIHYTALFTPPLADAARRVTKLVSRWCGGFTPSPSRVVSRTTEDAKPVDGTTATNPVNCLSSGGVVHVCVSSDRELALPSSGVRSGAIEATRVGASLHVG